MLTVATWKWGTTFSAVCVNVLRAALARHLKLEHELVCVTDDATGIDSRVRIVPMPTTYAETPRCRRRMQGFDRDFAAVLQPGRFPACDQVLYIDLDVVIVGDITALLERAVGLNECPIRGWRVGHAGVYSGSFLLAAVGSLHDAWVPFMLDPDGYPARLQPRGVASDQAMLNAWLKTQPPIPFWTEADGFVTFYGKGYERLEHMGVGPRRRQLPKGARIVVLGGADIEVLSQPQLYPWVRDHWQALVPEAVAS